MELYLAIIDQIEQANLPSTVNLTARRLLDRAILTGGHLVLSHADAMAICGTTKKATMRSHLVQLGQAEIIHYSTNAAIYITFVVIAERAQVIAQTSNLIAQRSQPNDDSLQTNDLRALSARNDRSAITGDRSAREMIAQTSNLIAERASEADNTIYPHAGAPVQLDGWMDNPTPAENDPSIPAHSQPELQPLTDDQRRTVALLADPDVRVIQASVRERIARATTFEEVRRQVAAWWFGDKRRNFGAGWLVTAIEERHPTPDIPADFRRTALYRRHLTPAEVAAEAAAQAALDAAPAEELAAEPVSEPPTAATAATELDSIWDAAIQVLRLRIPSGTFDAYFGGSRLVALNGAARISVKPHAVTWMQHQLSPKVLSALRHSGAEVESIEFVAQ